MLLHHQIAVSRPFMREILKQYETIIQENKQIVPFQGVWYFNKILESHNLRFGRSHDMNDIYENDKLFYVNLQGNPIHFSI